MHHILLQPIPFLTLAILLGAMIGSFLTMLVHRLPRIMEQQWRSECQQLLDPDSKVTDLQKESLSFPRSYCPHCQHPLRLIDNLPIFGYLINRGRCHHCHTSIHWRYLLLELLSVAVAVLSALHFGPGLQAAAAAIMGWVLLGLLFIDLEQQLLPDSLTLPLLWSGLLLNHQFQLFSSAEAALWGAVAGYLSLWGIFHLYRAVTGRSGMGHGDFKLFAALGAWCGWMVLPQILLLASISAIVIAIPLLLINKTEREGALMTTAIPFGPFLAIGGWATLLSGDQLTPLLLVGVTG